MVVALSLLLLLVFGELTGASEPLAVRRPLVTSSSRAQGANLRGSSIPIAEDVQRVELVPREVSSRRNVARGITDNENIAYTQASYNALLHVGEIPFEVALDTGSSDLWLVSDGCQTSQCKGTPAYSLSIYASPSFVVVNNNMTAFNVSFADTTSVSGFVARETVRLGSMQTMGQALAFITSSNVTLGESVSGLLGLGLSRLSQIAVSTLNAPSFFNALAGQGVLAYPLFGLSLTRNSSGTLSMGAIDKSVVSNASLISWHDVAPFPPFSNENATATSLYLHWAIPLNNITANGTAIPLHPTYPAITGPAPLALLDIGSNGIYGPFSDVAAIFFALGTIRQVSEGAWALPCGINSTMTFSFAGTNVTLQPSDYLIGPTEGDPTLCLSWPMALPPSSDGLDWHLGTPFLRTVYTVFSFGISTHETPLVGLYPLSNTTAPTSTPGTLHSLFSSLSATIATTVPPILLPTPTFSTPAFTFNTAAPLPTLGQLASAESDLGASTYSALFTPVTEPPSGLARLVNATALPVVDAPTTLATIVTTDASGSVHTTTSTASVIPTALLGKPTDFNVNDARATRLRVGGWKGAWFLWTAVVVVGGAVGWSGG